MLGELLWLHLGIFVHQSALVCKCACVDAVFNRYWNRVDDESLDVGQDALWWCCSEMRKNICISQHNITLCSVDWLIIFYYLPTNKIFTWSVFRSVREHDNATGNEKSSRCSPEFMNTSLWIIGLIDLHEKSIKIEWEDGIKHTIIKLWHPYIFGQVV